MCGRWTKPTEIVADEVRALDPLRESARFYFWALDQGYTAERIINNDGTVIVLVNGLRPLRFVPLIRPDVTQDGDMAWRRIA